MDKLGSELCTNTETLQMPGIHIIVQIDYLVFVPFHFETTTTNKGSLLIPPRPARLYLVERYGQKIAAKNSEDFTPSVLDIW